MPFVSDISLKNMTYIGYIDEKITQICSEITEQVGNSVNYKLNFFVKLWYRRLG